jgi:hypothetical protein
MRQREHDGEATTSCSGTFLTEVTHRYWPGSGRAEVSSCCRSSCLLGSRSRVATRPYLMSVITTSALLWPQGRRDEAAAGCALRAPPGAASTLQGPNSTTPLDVTSRTSRVEPRHHPGFDPVLIGRVLPYGTPTGRIQAETRQIPPFRFPEPALCTMFRVMVQPPVPEMVVTAILLAKPCDGRSRG